MWKRWTSYKRETRGLYSEEVPVPFTGKRDAGSRRYKSDLSLQVVPRVCRGQVWGYGLIGDFRRGGGGGEGEKSFTSVVKCQRGKKLGVG